MLKLLDAHKYKNKIKNIFKKKNKKPAINRLCISSCSQGAVVKEACPVLSQFPEGLLGKLQIRKSGKVQLKLGDIVMDVSEGAAFSFLQVLWVCVYVSYYIVG